MRLRSLLLRPCIRGVVLTTALLTGVTMLSQAAAESPGAVSNTSAAIAVTPTPVATVLPTVTPNRPLTLANLRTSHPRLLFTPEAEAALRKRIDSDPLLARFVERVRARSDVIASSPDVAFESIPFSEYGMQMLVTSRNILERVTAHGVMYRLTGERVYADRIWREMETALSFPTWNPAHYLDAAEMTLATSFAYDWAYDAWTPTQRALLRKAMVERALTRGLEIHETLTGLSSRFPKASTNWNSVSNTGMLAGALAMAEDEPQIASRVLAYAIPSLSNPKRSYEPDGGFEEGVSYWGYGTDFYTLAASMLQSALGDDAGMLDSRGIARTTLYRLHVQSPTGRNFSYADCWPRAGASAGYAILASRFGPAPARQHLRNLLEEDIDNLGKDLGTRLMPLIMLWLPPAQDAAAFKDVPLDAFFDGKAQLSMMRGAWDNPRAAYLGFKAGSVWHNHNHLDLGSFVFDQDGVRWSADLGPDDYTLPGYFRHERTQFDPVTDDNRDRPHRWSYLRLNNFGHSTLSFKSLPSTPPGLAPSTPIASTPGTPPKQDLQDINAVAPFVAHGSSPAFAFTIADLSSAYPAHASSWKRGVALNQRTWVAIRDELQGVVPGATGEWVMMTEAEVRIARDARSATLKSNGKTLRLTLVQAPSDARISAAPTVQMRGENPNTGITRLVVSWKTVQDKAAIEVHLVPDTFHATSPRLGKLADWRIAQ